MPKTAVILAGGRGTRLRPYTVALPKPLVPIGDYPILEIIIRQLVYYEFKNIVLAVNHQAELIQAFFGDGGKWGISIQYSIESKPLSTMGPLKIIKNLPENFLVMNGDILTDLNFSCFLDDHIALSNLFTIAASQRRQVSEYGVLEIDEFSRLRSFTEKPTTTYNVSMGIYALKKEVLDIIPADTFYGFDTLMYDLINRKIPVHVTKHNGYWLDIGRPDDYEEAVDKFHLMKDIFLYEK
jgi:NDP-sugar pyrophosphorylase family protein